MNILEYIEELIDTGMTEEEAEICASYYSDLEQEEHIYENYFLL